MSSSSKGRTSRLLAYAFLAPALVLLGGLVVWPALATIYRSFFDAAGDEFVGTANYEVLFERERLRKAVFNTFIWVAIFPALTTTVGLVLAVLTDKMRAKSAFRLLLFMPAAVALLSSGIIWRMVYDQSPDQGVVNAAVAAPASIFQPEGSLQGAKPSIDTIEVEELGGLATSVEVSSSSSSEPVQLGLIGFPVADLGEDPEQAATQANGESGELVGVIWRDTRPSDNERGVVEDGEFGLGSVQLQLVDNSGASIASTTSASDGSFSFGDVSDGTYQVVIPAAEFAEPWGGVAWLGPSLITLSTVIAGIWVWGGFALLVTASGLASIPRELLEASRMDGASEWQAFRYVTAPLLKPVLGVVFVSLTIHALKMFDLIMGIAPDSVQDEANTVALEMYKTAFVGSGKGVGSAIAVFLFVLALPIMALNIRRFKLEEAHR